MLKGRLTTYPGHVQAGRARADRHDRHWPVPRARERSPSACGDVIAPDAESDASDGTVRHVDAASRSRLTLSRRSSARRALARRRDRRRARRRLDAPLAAAEAAVAHQPARRRSTAVRTMYKRVGLDPTKTRPSSEALLRRVRKGDPLPRINSMVDVCNWCSLEFQLPYGLYDAAHIEGDVELRLGRDGRVVSGHPQGRRARGRPDHARRRRGPVRQSDIGFGADDGDDGDDAGAARRLRAARSRRRGA